MEAQIKLYSVGDMTFAGQLSTEGLTVEKICRFISPKPVGLYNVQLVYGDSIVHTHPNVCYESLVEVILGMAEVHEKVGLSEFGYSKQCPVCKLCLNYVVRTNDNVVVFLKNIKVVVVGVVEARCESCKQRFVRLGTLVNVELL